MKKARQPDVELTYEALEKRWTPLMQKFANRCSFAVECDDMMQELRIKLWSAQSKFDPNRGAKFVTYLYRAFQNTAAHHVNSYHPSDSLDQRMFNGLDIGVSDDYGLIEMSCITGKSIKELDVLANTVETHRR